MSPVDDDALSALHHAAPRGIAAEVTVDDATWRDLDLGDLVARMGDGCSTLGRLVLRGWLRAPASVEGVVSRREEILSLRNAPSIRSAVEKALAPLPRLPVLLLESLAGTARLPTLGWIPLLLTGLAVLSPALFTISTAAGVLGMGAMFMVNLAYRAWAARAVETATASLAFLAAGLRATRRLIPLASPELRAELEPLLRRLRPLSRMLRELSLPPLFDDFPGEYIRLFLLNDERRLSRAAAEVEAQREPLIALLAALGRWEAACAVARFTERQPLCSAEQGSPEEPLVAVALRHPLLENGAVGSDLCLRGGMVVTGSNMSGKSTFLRAVAINAVLAQALGLACAERFRLPPLQIATSLRNDDRLLSGESYYLAEALRLRTLLTLAARAPVLVAIDEPFRGTNAAERIAAGTAVMRALRRSGARVLVATHDAQMGRLLETDFEEGHFADQCAEDGLRFDYRLRPGRATGRNAIHLLSVLGYPAELVGEASSLVTRLEPGELTPGPAAGAPPGW